jgi:hypothetical protein
MAAHRAQLLLALLPNAMCTGFAEVEPELEPLKVKENIPGVRTRRLTTVKEF